MPPRSKPASWPPWPTVTFKVGLISKAKATELLGTMVGGYNVHPLIELLDDAEVAGVAADALEEDAC
jgi:aconitase B